MKKVLLAFVFILLVSNVISWAIGNYYSREVVEIEVVSKRATLDVYVQALKDYYGFEVEKHNMPFRFSENLPSQEEKYYIEIINFEAFILFLKANNLKKCYYSYIGSLGVKLWVDIEGVYYYWKVKV